MNWVDVAWVAMAAASLTLGLIYLYVWTKQPVRLDYLLFFVLAAASAAFGAFELAMMHADTPLEYATTLRWAHVPLAVFVVLIPAFVLVHFGTGRPWLAWTICALRVLTLILNFTTGTSVNFREITALVQYLVWGGIAVSAPIGVLNPWGVIPTLSNVLLLAFVIDASWALWRRGGADARRRAFVVGGSVAVCIVATAGSAALIVSGLLPAPTILTPAFLAVLAAMGYELGSDVIRSAQLSAALKASDARLRASEQRMYAVVEATPSAILLVDPAGTIVLANAQAERVFGYARADMLGQPVEFLVPERLRGVHVKHRAAFAPSVETRAMGAGRDLAARQADGSEVPIEAGLAPLQTPDGAFVLVSVIDITERRNIERAAAQQRAELAHMSRVAMLGALSGSIAHELNQPLTAILSNAQAAQRFLAADPPDTKEVAAILADIVKSDRRAVTVIERLRSLFKKDDGRHEVLDANEAVEEALRLLRSDLLHRGVSLRTDLASKLPPIRGDRVQLQQVLMNLIVNGCDAMETTAPPARRLVVGTGLNTNGKVEIRVADHGAGISSSDLDRIFEPFVTTKARGLGLGLALCRTIVDAHRGRMHAGNNPEGGATITVELPALKE